MTSSLFWTNTGIFLQPGDFNNLCNNFSVSADTHTKTNPHKIHHMSNSQNNCIVGTHYTTEQTAKTLNINMLHKGLDLRSIHFTIRKVVLLKKYFVSNFPTLKAYLIIF